ncbi:MAG: response regulator [Candidatus Acidiferrum sp.]|jgi:DNA-binding response OmpR family regulator
MMENKILIVEDDQDMVYAMAIRLRTQGYSLVVANDAISAISTARKEKPDLIILDLGLPAGDGFVVMKRLKALPDLMLVPVIVVSARDPQTAETLAMQAGAHSFFRKPCEAPALLAAIQNALMKPGTRP